MQNSFVEDLEKTKLHVKQVSWRNKDGKGRKEYDFAVVN
jgi:hypothetical protein